MGKSHEHAIGGVAKEARRGLGHRISQNVARDVCGREEDPALMVRCGPEFTPCINLLIPTTCYTVGTYFRYLREWEHPIGEFEGYFHEVKVMFTNRGTKKEGEEERE